MTLSDAAPLGSADAIAARILECVLRGEAISLEELFALHPELSEVERERLRATAASLLVQQASMTRETPLAPAQPVESASADEVRHFGAYALLRELGHGGQGVVYLARDTRLGRRVALKVLERTEPAFERLGSSSGPAGRLKREAEVASKLDHPGICAIYERGLCEGRPFIAMRYVEGETLARTIAAARETDTATHPRHRDWTRPVELIERAARALHVAHEAGVIHRDIKPANLMVTPAGEPVVLDFGMARDDASEGAGLTQTGDVLGSPAYMSPEQIEPQRGAIDARTDVYSLGVALFEYLTLRRPFESPTRDGLYRAILSEPPPDPRALQAWLPRDLAIVIGTALEKDPRHRYATARDFAEDLRRVRAREPILARSAGPLLRLRRWTQRSPGIAASIAGAFTVLAAVIVVMYLMLQRVRTEKLIADSSAALPRDPARALELALAADELGQSDPTVVSARMVEAWSDLREVQCVRVSERGVYATVFSPSSHLLATRGEDAVVRLWDVRTLEEARHLGPHESRPNLALSDDGRWLVTVSAVDPLRAWDTSTLEPRTFGPAQVAGLAFAPDSLRFAVVTSEAIAIHDVRSPQVQIRIGEGQIQLAEAAFWSPDSRWLAVTDAGGCSIWSVDGARSTVRTQFGLIGGDRPGFSSDGRMAVLPHDRGATVFDLASGSKLSDLPGPAVRLAGFDPTDELVVLCFQNGGAHLVEWRTGRVGATIEAESGVVDDAVFSRDGSQLLLRRSGACPLIYGLDSGARIELATQDPTSDVLWDEDDAQAPCLTTHTTGMLRRWSLGSNFERMQLGGGGKPPEARGCETAIDVIAIGKGEVVEVFSLSTRARLGELAGHTGELRWVDVSPDGTRIATASRDATARIWLVASMDAVAVFEHGDEVWAAEFSPDGKWLATCGNEGRLRLFAVDDPEDAYELPSNGRGLRSLCFSPSGDRLVSVSEMEGRVRLWDLAGRCEVDSSFIGVNDGHGGNHAPINACFHPDGRRVAITSFDGALYEWDTRRRTLTLMAKLTDRVFDADYNADGSLLALACGDGRIHLLQTESARETSTMSGYRGSIQSVAFSSDGTQVLAQDSAGLARLWPTDIRAAARAALAPIRSRVGPAR